MNCTITQKKMKESTFNKPGKALKYAFLYLIPCGSFQNFVGIDGNGLRQTNSPSLS